MGRMRTAMADFAVDGEVYGPGSSAYSPADTTGPDGIPILGLPSHATQADDPTASTSGAPNITVPRPPDPTVGGAPGLGNALGWTTGLLPSRTHRMPFTGQVVVVAPMGVHPVAGPVGFSNRQGRLANGVNALVEQWLPSQQQINEDVVNMGAARNQSPLRAGEGY